MFKYYVIRQRGAVRHEAARPDKRVVSSRRRKIRAPVAGMAIERPSRLFAVLFSQNGCQALPQA
jgi:hypothetical protein